MSSEAAVSRSTRLCPNLLSRESMPMPSSNTALSVRALSKSYRIAHDVERRGSPLTRRRREHETFWAIRDISFEVAPGEVVGIIGRNGAGKSTLLKILSRITSPTQGEADLFGRVGSLLEVGTGFHPELTGRENIFLNGSILGMQRREIRRQLDQIIDFSGVERFLDTPVKRYSSGMYVRLAFAVAAHLDPEILIVDEVLAVGDSDFQKKCRNRMNEVAQEGGTVLFVSHNMHAVLNICTRVLLMESGRLIADDDPSRVIESYYRDDDQTDVFLPERSRRSGDRRAAITHFQVSGPSPRTGQPATFAFDIQRPADEAWPLRVELAVSVLTEDGAKVLQLFSQHMGREFEIPPGGTRIAVEVDRLPLAPGRYRLNLWMGASYQSVDLLEDCYTMCVGPGRFCEEVYVENRGFPVVLPAEWHTETDLDAIGPSTRRRS